LPTDTQRERLDGVALTLGLGLATFATESGFREVVHLEGLFRDRDGEGNAYVDTPPGGLPIPLPGRRWWWLLLLRIPGLRAAVLTLVS